jgi:hypothetical protein
MNVKQQSTLKMLLALRDFLRANAQITSSLPNFAEFHAALLAAIEQIQANGEEQQFTRVSQTQTKNELQASLTDVMLDNSNKMQAYARYIKDTTLLGEVTITETKLARATDLNLINIARGLYAKINDNLQAVATYLLTADTQTAFQMATDKFQTAITRTTSAKVERKESTRLLAEGFDNAEEAVDNITSVVEIVRTTQPVFYANYMNTIQVTVKSGTLQVKGKITDAANEAPVADATVSFILRGNTKPTVVKYSAEKGGFTLRNLAEGIYNVQVDKTGYISQTVTAVVTPDTLCEVNVQLVKA